MKPIRYLRQVGRNASDALAAGEEEVLINEELKALLAAPTPLAFWRTKRGLALDDVADRLNLSADDLRDFEAGRRLAPLTLYRSAARLLGITLDDLAAD